MRVEPAVNRTWVEMIIFMPRMMFGRGTSQIWRFQLNLNSERREIIIKAVVGNYLLLLVWFECGPRDRRKYE